MEARYDLKVIVPRGVKILDGPRPEAKGAKKRRDELVGIVLKATDILIIEGVPYGELIPRDPQKPEYVRISEAGGLVKDQMTGKVIQFDGVLTYVKVSNLEQVIEEKIGLAGLVGVITLLIAEIQLLVAELREMAKRS